MNTASKMNTLQPGAFPRKRRSNTTLNSTTAKIARRDPKELEGFESNSQHHGTAQTEDQDDSDTVHMTELLSRFKIGRKEKEDKKFEDGLRVHKPSRKRTRADDHVWCCTCSKYRRVKAELCKRCSHDIHGCDACQFQHKRDDDENGPSSLTLGLI